MNGESTVPEHNVNRKLKNPKPVKEYGYNKEKKRWNVYTTRSKRKNTKLNENEFNDRPRPFLWCKTRGPIALI